MEIDNIKIDTEKKDFDSITKLSIETGTNCPQGGDASHGGRTYFKLQNVDGMEFNLSITPGYKRRPVKYECATGIELVLDGDDECRNFLKALKFAVETLEKQMKENRAVYEVKLEEARLNLDYSNRIKF